MPDRRPPGAGRPPPPGTVPDLLEGLTRAPGEEFLRWVVCHLSKTLGCDWVFVSERCGKQWERVRLVTSSHRGEPSELQAELPLAGTTCELLYRGEPWSCAQGIQEQFPQFEMLRTLGGNAYVGLALFDPAGRALGHLTLLHGKPCPDPKPWIAALESFQNRVAGELASRLAVRDLQTLLDTAHGASSNDALQALASSLAHVLRVKCGFVCELLPGRADRVRTLAISFDGQSQQPVEYDLADTPCATVHSHSTLFVPRDVQLQFPKDAMLKEIGAASYLGLRLDARDGTPLGNFGVLHDAPLEPAIRELPIVRLFTDRAAAELARRRAEEETLRVERKLFETQKSDGLGVLAGGIAHDFNNLLMGILGHASLARTATPAGLEPDLDSHVAAIETAARRAAELAQQMLAYSGRGTADVQPLDLSELVEETGKLLQASLPKLVELRFELARDLPAVKADATQLRQMVMNLVINGGEAIGERAGTIRVATGRVDINAAARRAIGTGDLADGIHVFFEVTDDGCGMDDTTRARIFEPFFTTKPTGRGLGLAAVQGITRAHRGALTLQSERGRGTTFRILFPACAEAPRRAPASTVLRREKRLDGLVVLIDDEPLVRTATSRMLERLGFEVRAAIDGPSGIALVEELADKVRLVLLDLTMPRMSGEAVFEAIRSRHRELRVVLMSGYSGHETIGRFRGAGLSGFLQKPFGLTELDQCLRHAIHTPVASSR